MTGAQWRKTAGTVCRADERLFYGLIADLEAFESFAREMQEQAKRAGDAVEAAEKERDALKKGKQFGHAEAVIRMEAAEKALEIVTGPNGAERFHELLVTEQREAALAGALSMLLERYVSLVNCGDCGNWNPEDETDVIRARAALAAVKEGKT